MKSQLLEMGLEDAEFQTEDGRVIRGEEMNRLSRTWPPWKVAVRGGTPRDQPAGRPAGRSPGGCPCHAFVGRHEHWFAGRAELGGSLPSRRRVAAGTPAQPEPKTEEGNGEQQ